MLLLPYTIVIRLYSILHPSAYELSDQDTVLTNFIFNYLGQNAWVNTITSILLCYASALLLNHIVNKSRFFNRQTLYPAFFFVILCSFLKEFQTITPALVGILFFVLFLRASMKLYRNALNALQVFNVGFFAIVASLIYTPLCLLVLASLITIGYFMAVNPKDYLKLLLGMACGLSIAISLYYYFDLLSFSFLDDLGRSQFLFSSKEWSPDRMANLGIIVVILLIGIVNYDKFLKKKIIDARKKIAFLFIVLFFLILSPVLIKTTSIYYLQALSVIASLFLALLIDSRNNNVLAEFFHLTILILLFGFQFNFFLA